MNVDYFQPAGLIQLDKARDSNDEPKPCKAASDGCPTGIRRPQPLISWRLHDCFQVQQHHC